MTAQAGRLSLVSPASACRHTFESIGPRVTSVRSTGVTKGAALPEQHNSAATGCNVGVLQYEHVSLGLLRHAHWALWISSCQCAATVPDFRFPKHHSWIAG